MPETYWLTRRSRAESRLRAVFPVLRDGGYRVVSASRDPGTEDWHVTHHEETLFADPSDFVVQCQTLFPPSEWHRECSGLEAGDYHRLIWRVGNPGPHETLSEDRQAFASSVTEALVIFRKLDAILQVIEPHHRRNRRAYGHETRQLLILACTEVENALRGVLAANGYTSQRPPRPGHGDSERWNTTDYVHLLGPLQLAAYEVELVLRGNWPRRRPFETWNSGRATESLPWYDAYNRTKHAREEHFHLANLGHLIDAAAAVFVLVAARFGPHSFGPTGRVAQTDLFRLTNAPTWDTRDTVYICGGRVPRRAVNYFPSP